MIMGEVQEGDNANLQDASKLIDENKIVKQGTTNNQVAGGGSAEKGLAFGGQK